MELRVLNYFLEVAREENITKAAQLLHITQHTLSRQIASLEEELGVELFIRSNHSINLTEEGLLLKRRAEEIITLSEKTKAELLSSSTELSGEISIGCGELKTVEFIAKVMAKLQKKYPLVTFTMISGNADEIKSRIESGLLDIGLLNKPVDTDKYESIDIPIKDIRGALLSVNSPLASKEYLTPKDLLEEKLLVPNRLVVQKSLAQWFGVSLDELKIVGTHNLLYNASVMVRNNVGIAIGVELDCEYKDVKFIPFYPYEEYGSVIAWKKTSQMSAVIKEFLKTAKLCLESIS